MHHGCGDACSGVVVWWDLGRTFDTQFWEAPRQPLHNCVSAGSLR